jgi:hypothetical protein
MAWKKTLALLDPETRQRLLESIEGGRLLILCGAGLSMPPPSCLMSAVQVARACYKKHEPIEVLPPEYQENIEQLAAYFYAHHDFKRFLDLVPWNDLVGEPNEGHAAAADLLITRAVKAVLSANFDLLIEQFAWAHKIQLTGALTAQEAEEFGELSSPLLKFHGCLNRGKSDTIWTKLQLADAPVSDRVQSCSNWMALKFPGAHLLVIGFWTDWDYLNQIIENALAVGGFEAVTVIDLDASETLAGKAQGLWEKLTSVGERFKHIRESSADVLKELQVEFSRMYARKFFASGASLAEEAGKPVAPAKIAEHIDALTLVELYALRQDVDGVPYNRAARTKSPPGAAQQAALAHLLLLHANAARQGAWYFYSGKKIRVVQAGGKALSTLKAEYKEPSLFEQPDVVLCAGAFDLGLPARIMDNRGGSTVVRATAGGTARWMTLDDAIAEFQL